MESKNINYAAWIGLDWGSQKHAICLKPADSEGVEHYSLEQKPQALHGWFMNLVARFGDRKLAIAIEQTRGAVIHFLLGLASVHIFTIHPKSLKNYRDAIKPSGAKDDPSDAELLLQAFKLGKKRVGPGPDIRKLSVSNARSGFFEKSEFEAILPHLPEDLRDFARFAYLTGMRKGEIASLQWAQYDRSAQLLTLEAAHSKNGEARTIPIVGDLAEIIERRWQARKYEGPNGEIVISPLVFHRRTLTGKGRGAKVRTGQPVKTFDKSWKAACEAANIGKKLFHDFRRSAARNLRRAGVPEEVAMKITGHKTNSMYRRYNITDTRDIREALEREQAYLKNLPEETIFSKFKNAESK